ncbi:peptidase M16 domain protein [Aminomonas paucivorans DSM 12260]|uniref:Peptidase M16 domain protein n=1 Tax=Aminomonas paucivorans DSM 12260 TaxID=584708 RepID=E3CW38_9BACT|nr:pitrilysin family protein [Aminomonas paucivorans]EFQ24293.1 peptidase M16 domain protein [Aminomonas paucivorans DSM 12260]
MKPIRFPRPASWLGALLLLWSLAAGAVAAPLPGGAVAGPRMGGVAEYRFPNGLTTLIVSDFSKPTVTVNAVHRVGSALEGDGEKGLAHLLEHLLFKGTPSHPDIPKEIAARGGRANGNTWADRTCYFEVLPATAENLDWALSLEAERMSRGRITPELLDKERGVVLNEMEMGENDPTATLMDRMASVAYDWHGYGGSTIGNPGDLKSVTHREVVDFYRRHMRPDTATIVVAGAVDEAAALGAVAKHFAPLPKAPGQPPAGRSREVGQDGDRAVTLSRKGEVQALGLLYHGPAVSEPDAAAFDLALGVLGDAPSGRLYRRLVEKGLASSVWAASFGFRDPSGPAFVMAQVPRDRSLDAAQKVLLETVEGFAQDPPSEEELGRARERILLYLDSEFADLDRFALGLSEWIARGDWRLFFLYRDRIARATGEDLVRAARRYLVAENRTLGRFVPVDRPLRVVVSQPRPLEATLSTFVLSQEPKLGASFDVSCAALDRSVTRVEVAPGLKGAFFPRKTRGGMVSLRLSLHLGTPESLAGRVAVGEFLAGMLDRGTARHSREQIQQLFDRLRATVSFWGGADQVGVFVLVPEEHLEETLALVAECLKEPALDPREVEVLRRETLAALDESRDDPGSRAWDRLERIFAPYPAGDVRRPLSLEEKAEGTRVIDVPDLRDFHRTFYGLSVGEVAAVGPFEPERMKDLLSRHFGAWRAATPFVRAMRPFEEVPPRRETLRVEDKPNAVVAASAPVKILRGDRDYPDLWVAATVLGGGWLDSRLATRIRHTEGTSYGVRLSLEASNLDDFGRWNFTAITGPRNVPLVERAFFEELQRALKDGFTPEEVARGTSYLLEGMKVDRSRDAALAGLLARDLFLGRTFAWTEELEARLRAVTPESALAALRRHLDPRSFSVVLAGDLKP